MRIAIVGPTHPIKGGVAQHTTVLAQELARRGHDVEIISWRRQYPTLLYPGEQSVERTEFPPFPQVRSRLAWHRPDSWIREARRLADRDLVVFAHVTPVQAPAYGSMIRCLAASRVRVAVICHNVLPHEKTAFAEPLVRMLLRNAGLVITHSAAQEDAARAITSSTVVMAPIAPFLPPGFVRRRPEPGEHGRLLFFGIVRHYKGLDLLLRALAAGPEGVRLRVVGEFWEGTGPSVALCRELGISERVELLTGYLPADEVPGIFADVDALVIPYRTATGSQAAWIGFEFGVPVITTSAGHLADDVTHGTDGLVCAPDDVGSLTAAISAFYGSGTPERLRSNVSPVDPQPYWENYLNTLLDDPPAAQ